MKLQYKSVERDVFNTIYVRRETQPYVGGNWHFHKEFELIYFLKGQGMRIVGDHISHFRKGELVLVGEWLPHLWRNDTGPEKAVSTDFVVIKFGKDFEGVNLFSLPELSEIRNLLVHAKRGILFSDQILPELHELMIQISESKGSEKLITFLRILQILANDSQYEYLSGPDFSMPVPVQGESRLQKVINYISANYDRVINLEEISGIASMTPPAFCRFFKSATNKTFSAFLNEVRISKACQLLINGEKSMKQICFEVGFNSLTNFNRTFRNFKGMAPSQYRGNYKDMLDLN